MPAPKPTSTSISPPLNGYSSVVTKQTRKTHANLTYSPEDSGCRRIGAQLGCDFPSVLPGPLTGRPRIWPRVILSRFIWLQSGSWGGGNESGLNKSWPLNTAVEVLAGYIVLYIVHATSIKYRNENRNLAVFHLLDRPAMLRTSSSLISPKGRPTTHPAILNRI